MTGHATPNVSKIEVEIPSDLYDLCRHLGTHAEADPLLILEMAALMGLCEISNDAQQMCFAVQLVRYLQTHDERLRVHRFMGPMTDNRMI